ncbi:hypothetical protein V7161_04940 [Neobacillus drentensis]|uniref:hypothetical protein n=1 Tax=Neobacillus drentensis TaxID=220684 RepID=UPI002FFF0E20
MSVSYVLLSTEEAIAKYNKNFKDYVRQELVKVDIYRETFRNLKGSLADQVVERAIWYMHHGYTVYGNGYNSYHSHGVLDCSGFAKLVFGDFGFKLSGVSKKYESIEIGRRVEGVHPKLVGSYWGLEGVENLRLGDILTWWKERADGTYFIGHVGIFMGQIDGKPTVICTATGAPTAIGIISKYKHWYGKHFYNAQRILPEGSWTPGLKISGHKDKGPVIPKSYVLPPQNPIIMP